MPTHIQYLPPIISYLKNEIYYGTTAYISPIKMFSISSKIWLGIFNWFLVSIVNNNLSAPLALEGIFFLFVVTRNVLVTHVSVSKKVFLHRPM